MTRNTRRFHLLAVVSVAFIGMLLATNDANAQRDLTASSASSVGLEPVWSKAITVGTGGKVTGLEVYVSPNKSYEGSEVIDRYGRRSFFAGNSLSLSRAGYNQTRRLTDLKTAELTALGLDPRSESKQIPEVTLYVRSNSGSLTAIDAESGHEKWNTQVGKAGYPTFGVSASDDYVVALSSSKMFLLDAKTGQILDTYVSEFLPAATPTIDGSLIYLPTTKGVVQVHSTEDLNRKEYTLGSSGSIDSPLTIGGDSVSWTTDQGYIYVGKPGMPGINYRFQSLDTIVAAPVYMDGMLFATSLDGFVYAISEDDGSTKWRYAVGGPIREAPMAIDGNVYVTTIDGQMASINATTGKPTWLASGVERFVAVSDSRVYCITSGRNLTVLDAASGGRIGSTLVSSLGLPVVNTNTDRVYLVNKRGVLQCLREKGRRWPIARVSAGNKKAEDLPLEMTEKKEAEAPVDTVPSAEQPPADEGDFGAFEDEPMADESDAADEFDDGSDPFADDAFGDDSGGDMSDPFGDDGEDPFAE